MDHQRWKLRSRSPRTRNPTAGYKGSRRYRRAASGRAVGKKEVGAEIRA
jgi:hypothetical protein